jgi:hypothetical protein
MVFGLGKQRSELGKFIDKNGIPVIELAKESGVREIDPSVSANKFWDI